MTFVRLSDTRVEHAWRMLAVVIGGLGIILVVLAPMTPSWPASLVFGAVQIGAAANLLWRHLQAHRDSSTPHQTALKLMRAEIVVLLVVVVYCGLFAWMGAVNFGAGTHTIEGRPVETRSDSRAVYMPDGQAYVYRCWKDKGRSSGTCPAEARWAALSRWPEPDHVEMQVAGTEIRSLKMDGQVIVDPSEFEMGDILQRLLFLSVGVGGAIFAVRAVQGRVRALKAA